MKKKILGILLTFCMVIGLLSLTAQASDSFTVTVSAGVGGKVSADGTNWTDSVTVTIPAGEKIGDRVKYRADDGYEPGDITSYVNITAIDAGRYFTAILDDKGNVYTAGDCTDGQRAVGDPLTIVHNGAPGVPS